MEILFRWERWYFFVYDNIDIRNIFKNLMAGRFVDIYRKIYIMQPRRILMLK